MRNTIQTVLEFIAYPSTYRTMAILALLAIVPFALLSSIASGLATK